MKKFLISIFTVAFCWVAAGATDYYVSPFGDDDADGSADAPFRTIRKAIGKASAGTTIFLREGTYQPVEDEIMRTGAEGAYSCVYDLNKSGKAGSPITIAGYPGEKVIIDLSLITPGERVIGFYVKKDYWHLRDFDIVGIRVTQTGHTQSINVGLFGGNNCVIERVNMHDGMGIGVYATRGMNNLVLNCDAYNNYDPVSEGGKGGNCDGFGFHMNKSSYTGNILRGCRAWRNSDDGFDLINNQAPVRIENCWAWENGYDADKVSRGDGTGIKSGGFGMGSAVKEDVNVPRNVIVNCIAWANKNQGIYANHHLGGLDFHNNSAYRNRRNYNMVNRKSRTEAVDVPGYEHHLTGNLAYKPNETNGNCININLAACELSDNTFFPDMALSDSDFESLDASQLLLPRKEDGSLPDITFLRLRPGTKAYEARVGYQFPYSDNPSGVNTVIVEETESDSIYYNLQGVPVSNPTPGIYIHNGRKVLVR